VVTGQAIWALATSIGLVALLVASKPMFQAVKLAGAAYLIFLGAQALIGALRAGAAEAAGERGGPSSRLEPGTAFWQGLISDLGNPKMAMFFASVLPQFATANDAMFAELLWLGLVFCAMAFMWLTGYAAVVAAVGDFLRRSHVRRAVEGVTGTVLVALGLKLATESR
jgi:threonine/homoserine/homoserine lactone efflux protein